MTRREHTTRAGCKVVAETHAGGMLAVTVVQPSGASALFAVHESDARQVAAMLAPPAVSRDAGEALYAALEELGVADDLDSAAVERAAVHVERYGERREEAGAEGEREQRAIERRGGPGR